MDGLGSGRRRRIVLISPRGPLYRNRTGIWKKSLRYAPLTLTTLASLVPAGVERRGGRSLTRASTTSIWDVEADIVGISAITGTAPRSYELAATSGGAGFRSSSAACTPRSLPDEVVQHADAVVVGYAEETWPQLLRDLRLAAG